jgi:2-dehydropantoate 2-reductase
MIRQLLQVDDPISTLATAEELRRAQLLKLTANAIINPLTAILDCKNGQLLDDRATVALIHTLIDEAGPVIRALLPNPQTDVDAASFTNEKLLEYVLMVVQKTATNTSSMLQDVKNGKKTEIDYINGFIVAKGSSMDLPCETHAALVDMIQRGESVSTKDLVKRFPFL